MYRATTKPNTKHSDAGAATQTVKRHRRTINTNSIVPNSQLQTKLSLGTSNDSYEQEADRVAEQVMRMPEPLTSDANAYVTTAPLVQRRTNNAPNTSSEVPASVFNVLRSPGQPLNSSARSFMEPRFGQDFNHVRVHTGGAASRSAQDVTAQAYTVGHHIVFGNGFYNPEKRSGQELIAHELTHVAQQRGAGSGSLIAPTHLRRRNLFQEIGGLFSGDTFDEATLQAYLTKLRTDQRIEDFTDSDNKARAVVTAWKQGSSPYTLSSLLRRLLIQEMQSGFTGDDDENAILEILWRSSNNQLSSIFSTISASDLNSDFHGPQWEELQVFYSHRFSGGMSNVLAGTITPTGTAVPLGVDIVGLRAPSAEVRTQAMAAINTEVRTSTGAAPTFQRSISGQADAWEVRIQNKINELITSMHQRMVVNRPARIPANMLADVDINRVAGAAQTETDGVYSRYYGSRPSFAVGTNIHDAFETRSATIAASTANADQAANFRVLKLLNGHRDIATINNQHGAIHSRTEEWALIAPILGFPVAPVLTEALNSSNPPHVTTGIVGTRRDELLDIHRNWSAFAGGGQIYMDRMKAADDQTNRDKMYRIFGTVIHEYVHTLEHPNHVRYRRTLGAQQGGFVLREGMTEYLAKRVWDQVDFTPTMRTLIEGSFQDSGNPNGHNIRLPPRYREWQNAENMANIIGLQKVQAAFFLGRVDLIGAV